MDELKELVEGEKTGLIRLTDKDEIVKKLQEIGTELLTNYEIRVKNITIEPLRVEPYFFKPNVFEDKFMHSIKDDNGDYFYGPKQRERFGKLYIHSGYSGVDIVLSDSKKYAFSFLIKNSRVFINGKCEYPFLKQYGVADVLKENGIPLEYNEKVLYKKYTSNETIVFKTIRNGLKNIKKREDFSKDKQNEFNELMISSFIELKEHTSSQYDFESGYGADKAVTTYLKEYKEKHPDISLEELDKKRKELYPNGSRTEFKKEFINEDYIK